MTVLQIWMLMQTGLLRAQTAAQLSPIKNPTKCKISPIDPEIRRWIMARKVLQYDVTVNLTLDLQDRKCHHRCHNCRHNCVKFWHNCESSKNVGGDYLSHVQSDSHDSVCVTNEQTHTHSVYAYVFSHSVVFGLFSQGPCVSSCAESTRCASISVLSSRQLKTATVSLRDASRLVWRFMLPTNLTAHAYQPRSKHVVFLMVKPNIDQISSYFERLVNWRWKPAALDHCT